MLDDTLYINIMKVFSICQVLIMTVTFYFFHRQGDSMMSKTLHRILFIHLILCTLSGSWLLIVVQPLLILPCVAFYSDGPLSYVFDIPSTEIFGFQLICLLGQTMVLVCLLTWQGLAVLVQLPSKTKYYIQQVFLLHSSLIMFITASIYPAYKLFPSPVEPCLQAAGITHPTKPQLAAFVLDLRDIKTQFIIYTYLETVVFYGIFGIVSCTTLIYKLNEKRKASSQANISKQKAISITVLALASVEISFISVPAIFFFFEYITETYNEFVIKVAILVIAFSHIIGPLALLFTLKTFRETLFRCSRFQKKPKTTCPGNTITLITMRGT